MSKLSECELISKILFNVQQVCYFDFKNNQENYIRSINFENEQKTNFQ